MTARWECPSGHRHEQFNPLTGEDSPSPAPHCPTCGWTPDAAAGWIDTKDAR